MTPFSNFHRRANEAAESKRDEARAASDRASALLDDLDGLLSGGAPELAAVAAGQPVQPRI